MSIPPSSLSIPKSPYSGPYRSSDSDTGRPAGDHTGETSTLTDTERSISEWQNNFLVSPNTPEQWVHSDYGSEVGTQGYGSTSYLPEDAGAINSPTGKYGPPQRTLTVKRKCTANQDSVRRSQSSLLASMLNLANTMVGSGMLGMGYAFAKCGVVTALTLFVFAWMLCVVGLWMLGVSACELKSQDPDGNTSFTALSRRTMSTSISASIDIMVALLAFFCTCSYLMVIGDNMVKVTLHFDKSLKGSWIGQRHNCIILVGAAVALPLSFQRTMDSLRFTSTLGIVCLTYVTAIVVLYFLPPTVFPGDPCAGLAATRCRGGWSYGVPEDSNIWKIISVFGIFIMNFCCAQNVPNVVRELYDTTEKRIFYVVGGAATMCLALFSMIGLFTYLTYGGMVNSDFLCSYPMNTMTTIGRLALIINLCCCCPLQCAAFREVLSNRIYRIPATDMPAGPFYLITILHVALAVVLAMFLNDFGIVISVLGGFFCVSLMIVIPAWFFMKLFPKRMNQYYLLKMSTYIFFIFGIILVPLTVGLDVYFKLNKLHAQKAKPCVRG